ncbi:hypothetical protein [Bifidobacterium pullorum]|uniref:hypothetical protein n=1 Tax=Bifidobacterium pullorum TaxID=78448 RepID=UPI000529E650|nr:hypothetical protein [Bifidobacterium pullorum]
MATDTQCKTAYGRLRPYCDGSIEPDGLELLDSGLSDEPYYALSWLIADILSHDTSVPLDTLLEAYDMLEDQDKEEYSPMLDRRINTDYS